MPLRKEQPAEEHRQAAVKIKVVPLEKGSEGGGEARGAITDVNSVDKKRRWAQRLQAPILLGEA